ncbi:hypothetical protein [Nostoc parmelioides]|uniref:Uncharacterized protein n=1 Tax=Nostoc parmelioides FACHB-3921 TaxID=2692909 RepID=A0ABR8BCV9_9NOSO|nr:hypothetical protein [Nostoc parmelioides]MBD2251656.1 hypothetical protein [Nostoc parmelioides FACHB-3921]
MNPVAVLIDYQDWQQIEKILETYQLQESQDFNINKYSGVIKLKQYPLEYQQNIKNEWT